MSDKNKKSILIATGLYPPDVGGPVYYAKNLRDEFNSLGFKTIVKSYGLEKKLPIGLRHLWYFFRVFFVVPSVDYIIILDTFSVGWPTVMASKIFGKKVVIRTGGDFLWETYVNRTKEFIILPSFYHQPGHWNFKEKLIFYLTRWTLKQTWKIVFSTDWQRNIWLSAYDLDKSKTIIIENYLHSVKNSNLIKVVTPRKYLWAGRDIFLKNIDSLKKSFSQAQVKNKNLELEIVTDLPQNVLFEKIKNCHILIVPSLSEISPNLVLEGLVLGKPFILTKETGYQEKLKGLGLFVNPLSIDEITEAILTMAQPGVYRQYCEAVNQFNFTHTYRDICLEFISLFQQQ